MAYQPSTLAELRLAVDALPMRGVGQTLTVTEPHSLGNGQSAESDDAGRVVRVLTKDEGRVAACMVRIDGVELSYDPFDLVGLFR